MTAKAAFRNKVDGFTAKVLHNGPNDYTVEIDGKEMIGGFKQLGEASMWANGVVKAGRNDWEERKRSAAR